MKHCNKHSILIVVTVVAVVRDSEESDSSGSFEKSNAVLSSVHSSPIPG